MSYNEEFDADFGGYASTGTWVGTDGYSGAGCVRLNGEGLQDVSKSDESYAIQTGDFVYFGYKVFAGNGNPGDNMLYVNILVDDNPVITEYVGTLPTSADWQLYSADLASYVGQNLTGIILTAQPASVFPDLATNYIYVDSIRAQNDPPPEPGTLTYGFTRSAGGIPGSVAS